MRLFIFILFLICFISALQGQDSKNLTKVETIKLPVEKTLRISPQHFKKKPTITVRFFKVKNARVKMALSFRPLNRKPKLV